MATPGWNKGSVIPFWDNEHTQLKYTVESFNNRADLHRWRREGWDVPENKFVGAMCDMRGIQPSYNHQVIAWAEDQFQLKDIGTSYYRMDTGTILPAHQDIYSKYIQLFNCTLGSIQRIIVFLEDWQSGHYFEIDGFPIVKWQKGDYVKWHSDTTHIAANLGTAPRYTLQITGHK